MSQYFRPRWNAVARWTFPGAFAGLLALGGGAWLLVRSPAATGVGRDVTQPVPFPHSAHAGALGIDCRYCHSAVETSASAGMPSTEVCMDCHAHVWTGLPGVEAVRASYRTGVPLAWRRVHDLPDHARFHHAIHVAKGFGCSTCHGPIDRMAQVSQVQPLHMEWCLECHRRPEDYVRPRGEVFNHAWRPPADQRERGAALVAEYGIRRETNCSACHH